MIGPTVSGPATTTKVRCQWARRTLTARLKARALRYDVPPWVMMVDVTEDGTLPGHRDTDGPAALLTVCGPLVDATSILRDWQLMSRQEY